MNALFRLRVKSRKADKVSFCGGIAQFSVIIVPAGVAVVHQILEVMAVPAGPEEDLPGLRRSPRQDEVRAPAGLPDAVGAPEAARPEDHHGCPVEKSFHVQALLPCSGLRIAGKASQKTDRSGQFPVRFHEIQFP